MKLIFAQWSAKLLFSFFVLKNFLTVCSCIFIQVFVFVATKKMDLYHFYNIVENKAVYHERAWKTQYAGLFLYLFFSVICVFAMFEE